MKVFLLIFALMLIASPINHYSQSKSSETTIQDIDINGKTHEGKYRIFLSSDDKQWIEVDVVGNKFSIPFDLQGKEKLHVRFVFDKYRLDFSDIYVSNFNVDWFVGVDDEAPFSEKYVSPDGSEKIKRIFYINFPMTQVVVAEHF